MDNKDSRETHTKEAPRGYLRGIVIVAIFVALAAAGGLIKLPSPVGSIALDSAPSFFVAGFFSPVLGGIVGFFGHLASASIAGFPLAFVHLLIACLQFLWALIFGIIVRRGKKLWALIVASIAAILLNGVAAPLILAAVLPAFRGMLAGLVPFLSLAAAINVVIAALLMKFLAHARVPGI